MNPESSAEYQQSVHWRGIVWKRYFQYHRRDMELLHLTRRLAALHIDKTTFSQRFGAAAWQSYSEKFDLFVAEGLLDESRLAYSLTPRGMFFSDSIAALLADGRWQDRSDLPRAGSSNDNRYGHM